MDLDLIRRLHKKVNIVLVIGKADALTTTEIRKLKESILQDLENQNIQLYQFPGITFIYTVFSLGQFRVMY